eukprot:NODE_2602_length_1139_cov_39.880435_g2482_i0.p1 GENE.NODE_2602_length_1139_cov_39.880435_g2482_i0~~NODE_2602_length_1139_cov_39.880435_g2482_i0.p1  ORF type:complete len:360 (-),score=113.19 NODE_2602_length_1139_cov_39.880435_g2482_i0:58-1104(-)
MAVLGLDTPLLKGVFLLYMGLWSALRLFVYSSKHNPNAPAYNSTSLLIFVCLAKLMMALGMFLRADGGFGEFLTQCKLNGPLFMRYALPALSYVFYDNLTFVNLSLFDPVAYVLLMQLRLVATGLIWSVMFGKGLNRNQWVALALITVGCVVKESGRWWEAGAQAHVGTPGMGKVAAWLFGMVMILLQICCGVFSSVFNEVLLKKQNSASINTQNCFMYTHSFLFNLLALVLRQELRSALSPDQLRHIFSPYVLPAGLIMASIGIVTSLFIKHLDSVRKSIASALEIFVDALFSFLLFGIPVGLATAIATFMVAGGVYYYAQPVEEDKSPEVPTELPPKPALRRPLPT